MNRRWIPLLAAAHGAGIPLRRELREALRRQGFSSEQLADYQKARLARIVESGCRNSRRFAERHGVGGPQLEGFAPMDRPELKLITRDIESRYASRWAMSKRTSGSSGSPLVILKPRSGIARELATTWRAYGWYGLQLGDPGVRVWGRPISGGKRTLNWLKATVTNVRQVSAFDVSEEALAERVRLILQKNPAYLYGYVSAIRCLAAFVVEQGLAVPASIAVVITTAEPLDDASRSVIETAFRAPCRDEYGASEVGSIAHECVFGRRHVCADNTMIEVEREDGSIGDEGTGHLLVTDLGNSLTPVIRYRLGDLGSLERHVSCPCGSSLPVLHEIHGRIEDEISTPDGLRHHPAKVCYVVDLALAPFQSLQQYQVVQSDRRHIELRVAFSEPMDQSRVEAAVRDTFRRHLHQDMEVATRLVDRVDREPNGKYKLVKNLANGAGGG